MGLSRIGGFSFCSKHITNLDFNLDTYKLISVDRPVAPRMTYREFIVPGVNGTRRYDNRYEDITIKVIVGVTGSSLERQQKITLLLQDWIGREDKLFFDDRPNLFYKARFYDAVTSKDAGTFTQITISFMCSYCMYKLYSDLRDYTVDNLTTTVDDMGVLVNRAEWQEITKSTIKQINNTGNYNANPIIEFTGTADLVLLEINNTQCSFANLKGTVFIDSENMVVYKVENNKKVSMLPQFRGIFPIIPKGASDIVIGGNNLNLDIIIDFKNTYIV